MRKLEFASSSLWGLFAFFFLIHANSTIATGAQPMVFEPDAWEFTRVANPVIGWSIITPNTIRTVAVTKDKCQRILIGTNGHGILRSPFYNSYCRKCFVPGSFNLKRETDAINPVTISWRQSFAGEDVGHIATALGLILITVGNGWDTPQSIYRSVNGGTTWTNEYSFPDGHYVRDKIFISPHNPDLVIVAARNGGVTGYYLRSIDGGLTWDVRSYGDIFHDVSPIMWDIVQFPRVDSKTSPPFPLKPSTIFISGEYSAKGPDYIPLLLRSDDYGLTWENIIENFPPTTSEFLRWHSASMATVVNGKGLNRRLYYQSEGGTTLWSDDDGETWEYTGSCQTHVLANPLSDGLVFSRIGGYWSDDILIKPEPLTHIERFYDNAVEISRDPDDPHTQVVGNPDIFFGDNGTWLWARSYDDGLWFALIPRL